MARDVFAPVRALGYHGCSRMSKANLAHLALLLVLPIPLGAAWADVHAPVRIEAGLVQGSPNPENTVVAFKGIPYAAPPVGDLRWREPQPAAPWGGIRGATNFGASCTQPPSPSGKRPAAMSEDCLFLNVWTPARTAQDKLAVLFFIHGGAGLYGSGNMHGEELAKKGILVVTLNYRLGLFAGMGHPELSAESPHHVCGNYGMLDIIAALSWVQRNIASFGGDPGRVTIAGQSSGANNVHYLTTSPAAKGLFHGAIAVSFPYDYLMKPHTIPFVRQKEENGVAFAKMSGAASLDDLRRLPATDLAAAGPAVAQAKLHHLASAVARDGWFLPQAYRDALDKGLASDVPTLTGFTADDFGPPASKLKTTVATFAAEVASLFGERREAFLAKREDLLALCPVTTDQEARETAKRLQAEYRMATVFDWALRRAKTAKTPVYTYIFEHAASSERGAFHGSDLAYWFNDVSDADRTWTEEDRRVADVASSYWANFVKTGNPNGDSLPAWARFSADTPSTQGLGTHAGPRPLAGKERSDFYRDLLDLTADAQAFKLELKTTLNRHLNQLISAEPSALILSGLL
jgi:para-nitrobenzyl esterase